MNIQDILKEAREKPLRYCPIFYNNRIGSKALKKLIPIIEELKATTKEVDCFLRETHQGFGIKLYPNTRKVHIGTHNFFKECKLYNEKFFFVKRDSIVSTVKAIVDFIKEKERDNV